MGKSKTKIATCTVCNKESEVSLYASIKDYKCSECKNGKKESEQSFEQTNESRIDRQPNKALSSLSCPYCQDKQMKVIGVISSPEWGDIVQMQCRQKDCWLVVSISEQSKQSGPIRTTSSGLGYKVDMTAEQIKKKLAEGTLKQEWVDMVNNKGLD